MNSEPKVDPHAPKVSWWLDPQTRESFNAAADREALRMRLSRESQRVPGAILAWTAAKMSSRKSR